jgi:hypothetical protein
MAATVHSLFAGNAEAPASLHPLLTELRDSSLKVLEELAIRMFDSADDALFEMGEKASNDSERRRYFDTMRVLRIDRNRVTREFSKQLAQGFINGGKSPLQSTTFDLDSLSIQPTEELEEKIALTNLAAKIEGMYKNQIWDVERRLEIVQMRGVPVSPQALNPSRICDAFGSAAAVLDTDFRVKLVVYKLFDRVLSRELERVYKAAIEVLDRHGFDGRKSFTAAPPSNPQPAQPTIDQSQQAAMELLRQNGFDPNTLRRTSDPAAQELADTLQGLFKQGGLEGVQASTQRLSMAGRMFNDLLSEPLLNDSLRSTLEPLRYPVYRTALADPTFFTSPSHPARKILGDLIELAAATQTGEISQTRFRALVQSAIAQAEGAAANPAQLNNLGTAGQALSGTELDGFIEQLREQSRSRRTTLLLHVRRLVSQELDLRTVGREVPKPVQTLLRSGIGPLMAVRLLKSGRGSPPFREAENLLERVLSSLEFKPPAQPSDLSLREQLLNDAVSVFKDIGMAEDKIEVLLNGLQDVYKTLDESEAADVPGLDELTAVERAHLLSDFSEELLPPAAPTAAPQSQPSEPELPKVTALELLSRILTPESWFRVFDPNQNQTRWLKLASFYANQDSVTFSGFDESTKLCLRGTRLADDLVKGHSEPINPTTSAREALDQLRRARELGLL